MKNQMCPKKMMCHDDHGNRKWIHPDRALSENFVIYQARYLGCTEVEAPRGIEIIKDAIKKIQFQHEIKKSEAGKKGSKLQKVEIWISIDVIKVINIKNKEVITQKPLHRISYCADDHQDKKLFSFIAREQDSRAHNCHAFVTEREAAELTVTLGQAFELAYKRYLQKGKKQDSKENKEVNDLRKQIEQARIENELLKKQLNGGNNDVNSRRTQSSSSIGSNNSNPASTSVAPPKQPQPSLLVGFETAQQPEQQQEDSSFDPFDNYLSNLAEKRGLGVAHEDPSLRAPFQSPLQKDSGERYDFQSPLQKAPEENPFSFQPDANGNPFDAFFSDTSSSAAGVMPEPEATIPDYNSQAAKPSAGAQFLPPPPSKQSIKAANALKMKQPNARSPEPAQGTLNVQNGNTTIENAPQDLLGLDMKKDESVSSLEKSLGAGLQFDSFDFDPFK
eukprot:gene14042-5021_t